MFNTERDEIFEELGWFVVCESPFEIYNEETNSTATGEAAQIVQDYLIENYEDLKSEIS